MSTSWVVTNRLIECFQHCIRTGDFHPFLTVYQRFLRILAKFTEQVVFSDDILCQTICQELPLLFSYLIRWNSKDAVEKSNFIKMTAHLEENIPKFLESLKLAIATSNWTKFYRQCKPIADKIINEARRQEVIDLKICYNSGFYRTFEAREIAINLESDTPKTKVEPEEKAKTGQDHLKISSNPSNPTNEHSGSNSARSLPEDFEHFLQDELSKLKSALKQDTAKMFDIQEEKTETRLRNMTTSSNCLKNFESRITDLGKNLETKLHETATGLTTALVNNQKEIAEKLKSLEQEIKSDERSSEMKIMKILDTAKKMELEDNERMTKRIEYLFGNLQKNYEEMNVNSMKRSEQKLDKLVGIIEGKFKSREENLERKMMEIKLREESLDRKMEVMMELMRKLTTKSENSMEQKMMEELVAKIERNTQNHEAKIDLREENMNRKLESMMELIKQGFDQKNPHEVANEEKSDPRDSEDSSVSKTSHRPMNEIDYEDYEPFSDDPYEINYSVFPEYAYMYRRRLKEREENESERFGKIVENSVRQDSLESFSGTTKTQILKDIKDDPKIDFEPAPVKPELSNPIPPDYPGTSDLTSLAKSDLLSYDEELQQIQEEFEKQLAEQGARHAAEMKAVKERGRQKNEKAQKEVQDLSRNLSRR